MKIFGLMCAMAFYVSGASAAEPTIINEPGKPIAAVFPSGNRAELRFARADSFAAPIEFQVTSNDCTTGIGQKLELKLGIRLDVYSWIWIQHTDPEKVNKDVTSQLPNGRPNILSLGVIMSNGSRYIAADASQGLPQDEITFTDGVKWIPGLEDGVFRKFSVNSWNAETMTRNPQTGENQNRISSGEFGLTVSPDGGGVRGIIEHSPSGAFFNSFENHGFFLLGDVVTWNFQRGANSSCQIGFKPNVAKAQEAVVAYISTIKFEFKPVLSKQDGMADVVFSYFEEGIHNAVE